jgi:hypothetical protein
MAFKWQKQHDLTLINEYFKLKDQKIPFKSKKAMHEHIAAKLTEAILENDFSGRSIEARLKRINEDKKYLKALQDDLVNQTTKLKEFNRVIQAWLSSQPELAH